MNDSAVLQKVEALTKTVERLRHVAQASSPAGSSGVPPGVPEKPVCQRPSRLHERVEDLEDLRDLQDAIAENGQEQLIPWEQAKGQESLRMEPRGRQG